MDYNKDQILGCETLRALKKTAPLVSPVTKLGWGNAASTAGTVMRIDRTTAERRVMISLADCKAQ